MPAEIAGNVRLAACAHFSSILERQSGLRNSSAASRSLLMLRAARTVHRISFRSRSTMGNITYACRVVIKSWSKTRACDGCIFRSQEPPAAWTRRRWRLPVWPIFVVGGKILVVRLIFQRIGNQENVLHSKQISINVLKNRPRLVGETPDPSSNSIQDFCVWRR